MGIDVDPSGNTATSLGERDSCISANPGDTFEVDVFVDGVTNLVAWEAYMSFDPSVIHVVDRDIHLIMASTPQGNAFDLSESVPDADGRYRISAGIISDPPESVSGAGVLARLSLQAQQSGITALDLGLFETSAGFVGPVFTDIDGGQIGDTDEDSFFDGPNYQAEVIVGGNCITGLEADPSGADDDDVTTVLTGGDDGSGLAWWVFLIAALGIVGVAGAGGLAIIALRRSPSSPAS
jgi:hypothetical protein